MLKPAVGIFIVALAALTGAARADIKVIYPPYAYQAPFEFCPSSWDELFTCGCHHGHRHHHGDRQQHRHHQMMGAAGSARVVRARPLVAMVAE